MTCGLLNGVLAFGDDISCTERVCSAKTYANSNYETTGAKRHYQGRVSITCNRGYETSGDVFCSVKEEGGDVNGLDLMAMDDWECGAKNCNERTFPNSASGSITGKTGDTVTVTCSFGYSTSSGASSGTVQCQTDGEFDALSCTGNKCAAKAYSNSNQDETNPVCFSFHLFYLLPPRISLSVSAFGFTSPFLSQLPVLKVHFFCS